MSLPKEREADCIVLGVPLALAGTRMVSVSREHPTGVSRLAVTL
jgi:hypothetical protein